MIYLYFDGLSIDELSLDELREIRERIASTNKVLASYIDRSIESRKDEKKIENKEEEGIIIIKEEEVKSESENAIPIKVETS